MADVIDDAQATSELLFNADLARALAARPFIGRPDFDGCCVGCGDLIDPERRAALPGARRCLECQEARERRERGL